MTDDTVHTLRHNQSYAFEDRKIEIQEEIDRINYPEQLSIFDYIYAIRLNAEEALKYLAESGFTYGQAVENDEQMSLAKLYCAIEQILNIGNNEQFKRQLEETNLKNVSRRNLEQAQYHLAEAFRNFEACEPSCAPGFDDGYVEVQLAMKEVNNLIEQTQRGKKV